MWTALDAFREHEAETVARRPSIRRICQRTPFAKLVGRDQTLRDQTFFSTRPPSRGPTGQTKMGSVSRLATAWRRSRAPASPPTMSTHGFAYLDPKAING